MWDSNNRSQTVEMSDTMGWGADRERITMPSHRNHCSGFVKC